LSRQKQSPLKDKPLRQAGQSVQEQLDELIDDKFMNYVIATVVSIVFAMLEWYRWYMDMPPRPILATIITVIIIIYCLPKLNKLIKQIKSLKLGRDGEKVVGEFLEKLRQDGCIVFHDILGDGFNIDHVVISEKGIYCIETKTYSKPNTDEPRVHYKDGKLIIDGLGDKSNILKQVKAASKWLRETLKESTGQEFKVKPVILFPGWWIDTNDYDDVWVLELKGFPKFLNNQYERIPADMKNMAGLHLSRHIKAL